jgi:protein-S-isoprenylcysteine O-methyltransferase Ste14
MEPVRIVLFLGLVLHKFLWEFLRNKDRPARVRRRSPGFLTKWVIKPLKALVLAFLAFQTLFLNLFPIAEQPSALQAVGILIYFVGLGTAVLGRVQLGKNWMDLEDFQVLPTQSLTTRGIYGYIRHPIYTGDILLLVGLQLALNSWLVLAVLIPLAIAVKQALAEEAVLAQGFPNYQSYCKRTKRFIPFIA